MSRLLNFLVVCAVTSWSLLVSGGAASKGDESGHSCASIRWNPVFLDAYPTAAAACRKVDEINGVQFAEFRGTISQVNHDVVQVEVSNVVGTPISTIAFLTGRDGQIVIDRAGKTISDLKRGDELTFWIREGRFGVSPNWTDHPMLIARPERVEELIENLGLPDHFLDLR
jgi:hypothetical protein